MKWALESLANEYKQTNATCESNLTLGLGYIALKAFYGSLGIQQPITADLSANLIRSCMGFLLLHPTYAPLAIEDMRKFLLFVYKKGGTRVDYSSVITHPLDNSPQVTQQHPRWKS